MADKKTYKRVLLAYSGGLDTSIIIPWLKENYGCAVVCCAADVGQGEELAPLHEKAKKTGAEKLYIEDLRKEFVEDFIWPTLKADAIYEGKYLLGTSFARPLIAKRLVEIAETEGSDAICHGCTGKGNDQVRFELSIKAFAPNMPIIAPWREWDIKTREEEIEYADARGIPVPVKKDRPYSMDRNIWHLSHEGCDLEDPANEPPRDLPLICKYPEDAPDKPEYGSGEAAGNLQRNRRAQRRGHCGHGGEPSGGHEVPRCVRDPRRNAALCRAPQSGRDYR